MWEGNSEVQDRRVYWQPSLKIWDDISQVMQDIYLLRNDNNRKGSEMLLQRNHRKNPDFWLQTLAKNLQRKWQTKYHKRKKKIQVTY